MIRLCGGQLNGRRIAVPPRDVRPLPARARESLFNRLRPFLAGQRVLDLFAGSGLFAIEALSHGADAALLVEKDRRHAAVIRDNLRQLGLESQALLLCADLFRLEVGRLGRCGIIFADPPFDCGLEEPLLEWLQRAQESLDCRLFILKHAREFQPSPLSGFSTPDRRDFAGVSISFWHREA